VLTCYRHPWFDKINSVIWTTLDSSPNSRKSYGYSAQSKKLLGMEYFAEKAMKKSGLDHIKTLHGAINQKNFIN